MKSLTKLSVLFLLFMFAFEGTLNAQFSKRDLEYYRYPGKEGINVFEAPKTSPSYFDDELYVRIGGDYAVQFQGIRQSNDLAGNDLIQLQDNLNLPTANLNFDVQIHNGLRMHLRTYLSSRHHSEAWVKGGYFQVDRLDFIQEGFLEEFMQIARVRFGMDEINYGDAHFRRSDNARAMYNPFVGNYIMDAFATEPYAEFSLFPGDALVVLGVSNGRLNQSPTPGDDGFVVFGKLGYDSQINTDLRFRLTGSFYSSTDGSTREFLYNGDRAGGRYYEVLHDVNETNRSDFTPRFNPGFGYQTAFQFNPFLKYRAFEFFGIVEFVENGNDDIGGNYTQLAAEGLYRFGGKENLYFGGRYNFVTGEQTDNAPTQDITRVNIGGGWFLTNNVMAKLEYVNSFYEDDGFSGTIFEGAEFSGVVFEAIISF